MEIKGFTQEDIIKKVQESIAPYKDEMQHYSFSISMSFENGEYISINRNTALNLGNICPSPVI